MKFLHTTANLFWKWIQIPKMKNVENNFENHKEEWFNKTTHGLGFVASIFGMVYLIVLANQHQDTSKIWVATLYGTSLILLYTASTLYHSFQSPALKHYFKIFDHAAIYLLIAGSYTPFTLYVIQGFWGYVMLATIWTLAILGIVFKLFFVHRFLYFSTALYLAMGWLAIFAIQPIFDNLPLGGLVLLIIGGLSYTFGVLFFLWEKLPYNHAIWHLFVLSGSTFHFFSIALYIFS